MTDHQISAAHGRSTRTFRRIRNRTLNHSDICMICGHPGADAGGHVIARAVAPHLAEDPDNIRPIHGADGCPTCLRKCNNEMGDRSLEQMVDLNTSRDWFTEPITGGRAAL